VAALAALILTVLATRRNLPFGRQQPVNQADEAATDEDAISGWGHELLMTLRRISQLPGRIVAGLRARTLLGGALLVLAGALIVAFALSGHAAAVHSNELAYALAVDLFHLVCNAAWVGGLLYISVVFVPALAHLDLRTRARVLALGLPEFGAVAILSAFLLAATGTLNTTIHLTSIDQFLTTAYGRTLFVKIELFLLMVGISAWHAFHVRPQLAQAIAKQDAMASVGSGSPVAITITANGATRVAANAPSSAAQSRTAAPSIASRRSQSSSFTASSRTTRSPTPPLPPFPFPLPLPCAAVRASILVAPLAVIVTATGLPPPTAAIASCSASACASCGRTRKACHALMPTISRKSSILTKSVRP